jgi:hypothetical protein
MAGTPTHERARLANAIRHHPGDHEAITEARAALKAAGLEARIRRDVGSWPPLSAAVKAELAILLLSPSGGDHAAT